MTLSETETLSKSTTTKALSELRQHLAENPSVAHRLIDTLRESGKKDEAQLTSRFLDGNYPGVPYTVQKNEAKEKGRGWWVMLAATVVVVAVVVVGVFVLNAQDGGSKQDL